MSHALLHLRGARPDALLPDADYDPVAEARAERKQRKLRNEAQRLKNVQRSAPKPSSAPAPSSDPRTGRKAELDRELRATRASTASMGKFDKVLDGDTSKRGFKRKFDANEQSAQAERSKSLAILSKLGQGSGPRQHVSDDSPAKRRRDDTVNTRRAIRQYVPSPLHEAQHPISLVVAA